MAVRMLRMTKATAFDLFVFLAGLALVAVNLTRWVHVSDGLRPQLLLAAALVVVLSKTPLLVRRRAGDINIGFDCCALVYLTLVTPAAQTLVLWAAGTVVAHGLGKKPLSSRIFNVGVTNIAGTIAVAVIRLLMPGRPATISGLLAVAAGCSLYFVIDVAATAFSLRLMGGDDADVELSAGLLLPLLCFVGVDTLGYLGALLTKALPAWTLLLLGVPVGTILVAGRSVSQLRDNETRLSGLFEAAAGAQKLTTADELERSVVAHAAAVLPHSDVCVRETPPGRGEIGSPLDVGAGVTRYVIARRAGTRSRYNDRDQQALDALTALAVESMARIRLVDEMAHLARYDTLTGLPNRALLHDRIGHALSRRARTGYEVALLYCDLDGFKAVNDRVGHHVGDELLTAVAERLRECVRPIDTAARLGGDEFAVLLEDVSSRDGAVKAGERIVAAMAEPFVMGGETFNVGISVGVAFATEGGDGDELMREADMAMYRAKALGKNRVESFQHEMRMRSLERIALEDDLRVAVRERAIEVHYQPVVDLRTGDIAAVEALARWRHPSRGLVPAGGFVAMSEQMGLIRELGAHVVDRAHADVAALCRDLDRDLRLSVNVSARQLADGGLARQLRELRAARSRVGLVVELTESALIEDDDTTLAALRELQAAGVAVAIDDFGVGYSSVGYLRRLSADILKIDGSFTDASASDPRTRALTSAVLAMAGALDITVIAEGIESPAHATAMRALGCAYGQGFLLAEPMPIDGIRELLTAEGVAVPTARWSAVPALDETTAAGA
jgi:diguanylate cyclase (GGDEF)-like protein